MTAGNGAILYDASGNPLGLAQGATVPSAQTGAITAGSDYAATPAARIPKVDALGQQYAVPIAANGQSLPVLVNSAVPATTAAYGQIALAWCATLNSGSGGWAPMQVDATGAGVTRQTPAATFNTTTTATTTTTANKSMLSFYNSGSLYHRIYSLFAICPPQTQLSSSTGLLGTSTTTTYTQVIFAIYRTTGHSGGTLAVPMPHDTADTIDASLTVRANGATVTGESANAVCMWDAAYDADFNPVARIDQSYKALTVPPGTGLHVKCIVAPSTSISFYLRAITAQSAT